MQTDMHYYGTYAMAQAAGLHAAAAQVIAQSAEYVDDSDSITIPLQDGTFLEAPATAHHPVNRANLDEIDQRKIWIPFHFIPANQGESLEERLVCRKDSGIAQEMVAHHAELPNDGFSLELMGITAHVYADTFSHYGFSGISSDRNRVDADSITLHVKDKSVLNYIVNKTKDFKDRYIFGAAANALSGLGHGAVSTYPDRPYLRWSFRYETTKDLSGDRVNHATFLEACEKLHRMFSVFGEAHPTLLDKQSYRRFDDIKDALARILAVEGGMAVRVSTWQDAVKSGAIFPNPTKEQIPVYAKNFEKDIEILGGHTSETIFGTSGYAFLRAAKFHRDYVLDELLPKHNLHVLVRS